MVWFRPYLYSFYYIFAKIYQVFNFQVLIDILRRLVAIEKSIWRLNCKSHSFQGFQKISSCRIGFAFFKSERASVVVELFCQVIQEFWKKSWINKKFMVFIVIGSINKDIFLRWMPMKVKKRQKSFFELILELSSQFFKAINLRECNLILLVKGTI